MCVFRLVEQAVPASANKIVEDDELLQMISQPQKANQTALVVNREDVVDIQKVRINTSNLN